MLITFPEKVKSTHVATLLSLGYPAAPEGNLYARSMPDLWQRDAEGKVVKAMNDKGKQVGQYAVIDCSTLEKAVNFFKGLVQNKQVIGYVHRVQLPDGKVRFGSLLVKSAALTSPKLIAALGFDPTALVAKKG